MFPIHNPNRANELHAARQRKYYAANGPRARTTKPFIGVDGEGAGVDEYGRQNLLLLRAGRRELFNNNLRLGTADCIDFLLSAPANALLCGYYFTYDATQILRDLPRGRLEKLFEPKERGEGKSPYVFWDKYAIDFQPRQFLRVARLQSRESTKVIPGSARTINEVGGFFQKSFVEALKDWSVCDAETLAFIASQKDRRSEFVEITELEKAYCKAECKALAQLMEKLREVCAEAKIEPRQWRGAGWLAARLHEINKTPKRKHRPARAVGLDNMAMRAYYGGRFEITTIGRIPGPIYEYDINSAYPAAMLQLPCPLHTKWKAHKHDAPEAFATADFAVADICFDHQTYKNRDIQLCGFPVRRKGKLFWPQQAGGIYWKDEILAAKKAGAIMEIKSCFCAKRSCQCSPYVWVKDLYEYRKSIGKSQRGYPIKLGINGLYGKLAQRQGDAPYRDHIAAGMITAITRAKLIEAYTQAPDAIVMMATDSIFSTRPLQLDIGDRLGQWEHKLRPTGLFVVQPGIYWSPGSDETQPKTRGIPRSKVIEHRAEFEQAWDRWCAGDGPDIPPSVTVPMTSFIGHRLALARNKPQLAGCWLASPKAISFDWQGKRQPAGAPQGGMLRTRPIIGSPELVSEAYDPAAQFDFEQQMLEQEAAPDYEPWGNSGE